MRLRFQDLALSLFLTLIILAIAEIFMTTFSQLVGLERFRLQLNILIILFLALKMENPFLAIIIFTIQYFHSLFSIEGWAMGTFAGVTISIIVSHVRDVIHFSNAAATMMIAQISQTVWFIIVAILMYIRSGSSELVIDKLWRFIPESIILSLLAPLVFGFLETLWRVRGQNIWGERN
jgi:hypothetical protein